MTNVIRMRNVDLCYGCENASFSNISFCQNLDYSSVVCTSVTVRLLNQNDRIPHSHIAKPPDANLPSKASHGVFSSLRTRRNQFGSCAYGRLDIPCEDAKILSIDLFGFNSWLSANNELELSVPKDEQAFKSGTMTVLNSGKANLNAQRSSAPLHDL